MPGSDSIAGEADGTVIRVAWQDKQMQRLLRRANGKRGCIYTEAHIGYFLFQMFNDLSCAEFDIHNNIYDYILTYFPAWNNSCKQTVKPLAG